jgi:hypothetical protein
MQINTKYNIGDHVWCIYKNKQHKELEVYDDKIESICIDKDGVEYYLKEGQIPARENEIILYADEETLVDKLYENMEDLNKEENNV